MADSTGSARTSGPQARTDHHWTRAYLLFGRPQQPDVFPAYNCADLIGHGHTSASPGGPSKKGGRSGYDRLDRNCGGAVTYRVLFHAMGIMDQSKIGYDAWRTAMQTFSSGLCTMFGRNDFQHIVAALWLMGCTAIAGVLLWRLRSSPSTDRDTRVPTVVYLWAAAAASVLGPITLIAGGGNGLTN